MKRLIAHVHPALVLSALVMIGVVLVGCAAQSFTGRLKQANDTVTAVVQGTDTALNAHLITADQAQAVSTIAHQVGPLLDAAQAADAANDPTSANKSLNAVNQILAGLKAYVPPAPPAK